VVHMVSQRSNFDWESFLPHQSWLDELLMGGGGC
jgi:hypothetical protein